MLSLVDNSFGKIRIIGSPVVDWQCMGRAVHRSLSGKSLHQSCIGFPWEKISGNIRLGYRSKGDV